MQSLMRITVHCWGRHTPVGKCLGFGQGGGSRCFVLFVLVAQVTGLAGAPRARSSPSEIPSPSSTSQAARSAIDRGKEHQAAARFTRLPLRFEPTNENDPETDFICRAGGYRLLLTKDQCLLQPACHGEDMEPLSIRFPGSLPTATLQGRGLLTCKTNYFLGKDPSKWRKGVPNYSAVAYQGLYPGIDARYYSNGNQLEVDFEIAPGADPNAIRLGFSSWAKVEADGRGNLSIVDGDRTITLHTPTIYQEAGGIRKEVLGEYRLEHGEAGFHLSEYDPQLGLVIDPVLDYSTFLGGSDSTTDFGTLVVEVAIDAAGNAYITGSTDESGFPVTPGAFQSQLGGGISAFVVKLSPDGGSLVYATYIGGVGDDEPTVDT
ncbi:MAG TPA: hypothetical protein VI756_12795, partial [Blastocatellia bacterium]